MVVECLCCWKWQRGRLVEEVFVFAEEEIGVKSVRGELFVAERGREPREFF
jgi:hypothetical protein